MQRAHEHIDTEFVHSGDYTQIRQTADLLRGLIGRAPPCSVATRSNRSKTFPKECAGSWVKSSASMTLQRYKGLGRDESERLGDDHGYRQSPAC